MSPERIEELRDEAARESRSAEEVLAAARMEVRDK